MNSSRLRFGLPALLIGATLVAGAVFAAPGSWFTPVPVANPKVGGMAAPNVLPPELVETPVAQGSYPAENPAAGGVAGPVGCPTNSNVGLGIGFYGYLTDAPMIPLVGDFLPNGHKTEASKTEPDENTYLITSNQHGPSANYDYGKHFLYQGHEVGRGYITRINLDADGPHRVTVLATTDSSGCPVPTIDGSGWYPFSDKLLFTSESTGNQSIIQATPDYPSTVDDLTPWIGKGAFEGVVPDKWGRIYLVEDAGGAAGSATGGVSPAVDLTHSKQPNSFVYRFILPMLPAT